MPHQLACSHATRARGIRSAEVDTHVGMFNLVSSVRLLRRVDCTRGVLDAHALFCASRLNMLLACRRYSVVASSLKLVAGEGTCLLMFKYAGRVSFFRVLFDDDAQTFRQVDCRQLQRGVTCETWASRTSCRLRKVARIGHVINQGYVACDRRCVVVLARPSSYVAPLAPPTLREAAFEAAQRLVGKDAVDDSAIRRLCHIQHTQPLL